MEKEQYWMQIFQDQKKSGLSVVAFCKQNNILESTYYYYRGRYVNKKKENDCDSTISGNTSVFQPITIEDNSDIDFTVNGLMISCKKSQLKDILGALK